MPKSFEFETDRLLIRPPVPGDAEAVARSMSDRDVVWHLGRAPYPYQLSDAEAWINRAEQDRTKGREYAFVILYGAEGVIGSVGFNRSNGPVWEIGYWLGKPWWGQGLVTEAAQGLLEWGRRECGIESFVAGHFSDNPASGRVLKKLGFQAVGEKLMLGEARGTRALATRYVLNAPAEAALRTEPH